MSLVPSFLPTALHTALAYLWWGRTELRGRLGGAKIAGRPEDRHALLLAWALPPTITGGVYRPTSFLRYGPGLGWRMSAISGPLAGATDEAGRYLLETVPASVRIHRLERPTLRPSWRFFPRIDGGFLNALATVELALRTFEHDPPSVVIASGPPFHNFVAAMHIARSFGAKLVLDYRDEWSQTPFHFVTLGNADKRFEARALRHADAVVFTTQSQLQHQLAAFDALETERCSLIPNGWDSNTSDLETAIDQAPTVSRSRVVLSFVGNLGGHCPPHGFVKTVNRVFRRRPELVDGIELRLVGPIAGGIDRELDSSAGLLAIERTGLVPNPKARSFMRDSDALVLFANENLSRYIPAKLYEYVAAGPPILVYGCPGEASRLVQELGAGVFVPEGDSDALETFLDRLTRGPSPPGCAASNRQAWLERHTREALARRLFDIVERL